MRGRDSVWTAVHIVPSFTDRTQRRGWLSTKPSTCTHTFNDQKLFNPWTVHSFSPGYAGIPYDRCVRQTSKLSTTTPSYPHRCATYPQA
jgi:hypothetical protein